jgi:hypothetical protein
MQCVYFHNGSCLARLIKTQKFKITEADFRSFCGHVGNMMQCPRLNIYQNHLKAQKGK